MISCTLQHFDPRTSDPDQRTGSWMITRDVLIQIQNSNPPPPPSEQDTAPAFGMTLLTEPKDNCEVYSRAVLLRSRSHAR